MWVSFGGDSSRLDLAIPQGNHLIEVAELVSMALPKPDTELKIAALLRDTLELTLRRRNWPAGSVPTLLAL